MRLHPLYLLLLAFPAHADDSGRLETALKEKGFRCTELPRDVGAICIDQAHVTVIVPKGVRHARTIYFAHGDLNVCAGGLSGESRLLSSVESARSRCCRGAIRAGASPTSARP